MRRVAAFPGHTMPSPSKAIRIAAQIVRALSTSVPSQSNTANRITFAR
jgi:hypothetical protein